MWSDGMLSLVADHCQVDVNSNALWLPLGIYVLESWERSEVPTAEKCPVNAAFLNWNKHKPWSTPSLKSDISHIPYQQNNYLHLSAGNVLMKGPQRFDSGKAFSCKIPHKQSNLSSFISEQWMENSSRCWVPYQFSYSYGRFSLFNKNSTAMLHQVWT